MMLISHRLTTRKRRLSGHRTLVAQIWGFKFESQISLCKAWGDHLCLKPQWRQVETQYRGRLLAVSLAPCFRTRLFLRKIKQSTLKQHIQHRSLTPAYSYTHTPHPHPAKLTINIKICTRSTKMTPTI